MAHSYTPGLRVSGDAMILRERRLPLKGEVIVGLGAEVAPDTVVARTELPGNIQTLNLAAKLSVDPARVAGTLTRPLGAAVRKGEVIAMARSLFGLMRNTATSPADGVLESVSSVTGQLILRESPIPVEMDAYVRGTVARILPDEGVVIEARGAFMQGIFGVGGETFGAIDLAVTGPDKALKLADLKAEHRGRVVVGGAYVSFDALQRAREVGVAAVIVGGFDDHDLKRLLGRDLGVAITGSEEIGLTLVLTEGFGRIGMAQRTWKLLERHRGDIASVSGATQIRAGVMRPEILVAHTLGASEGPPPEGIEGGLDLGSLVRVIREPYFGRIGKVVELPPELQPLDTEALVRVLVVRFADDDTVATVPRANIERISD